MIYTKFVFLYNIKKERPYGTGKSLIKMNDRGQIVLPIEFRKKLGLEKKLPDDGTDEGRRRH